MDTNRAEIEAFFQNLEVGYTKGFNTGKERSILDKVAMVVPSTTAAVVHVWLEQLPRMREWIGDRLVENIKSNGMTIKNKLFESTKEMPRTDIEDDQHGLYLPIAELMGADAAAYPDKLCVDELVDNNNWLADAASFFKADRQYGSNVILNYTTNELTDANFEAAYTTMTSYLGHSDDPLNVVPFALVHGPTTRGVAWDITTNDIRAIIAADASTWTGGGKNRNKGLVVPIQSSRLVGAAADYWYLLGEVGGIRGIIYQQRKAAEFQASRLNDDSDFVFETDKYQFGARARGAAFLSLPHLIHGNFKT